ncbi:MAG: DNA-binding domain-containing protein [Leptospirales bacterium]|nr:DNA-binding domain-containing protein [Leptospirales bacterium]
MRLDDFQREFMALISSVDAPLALRNISPELRSALGAGLSDEELRRRLQIYINGAQRAIGRSLAEQFPALRALLGAVELDALIRRFAAENAAGFAELPLCGAPFVSFLAAELSAQRPRWLLDVAQLESLSYQMQFAADGETLELQFSSNAAELREYALGGGVDAAPDPQAACTVRIVRQPEGPRIYWRRVS